MFEAKIKNVSKVMAFTRNHTNVLSLKANLTLEVLTFSLRIFSLCHILSHSDCGIICVKQNVTDSNI